MHDYRTAAAYMQLHHAARRPQPVDGHPARRVYQLPPPRRTPRTDGSR